MRMAIADLSEAYEEWLIDLVMRTLAKKTDNAGHAHVMSREMGGAAGLTEAIYCWDRSGPVAVVNQAADNAMRVATGFVVIGERGIREWVIYNLFRKGYVKSPVIHGDRNL